jgi:hypothetical protein
MACWLQSNAALDFWTRMSQSKSGSPEFLMHPSDQTELLILKSIWQKRWSIIRSDVISGDNFS